MPLYQYSCPACEATDDRFLPMRESDSAQVCNECGHRLRRVFSAPRVSVKSSAPNTNEMTRAFHGLGRGDQIFENPRNGEVVHLKGSKQDRQDQIAASLQKAGYPVSSRKDVTIPNL